jgi:hypothetical protein
MHLSSFCVGFGAFWLGRLIVALVTPGGLKAFSANPQPEFVGGSVWATVAGALTAVGWAVFRAVRQPRESQGSDPPSTQPHPLLSDLPRREVEWRSAPLLNRNAFLVGFVAFSLGWLRYVWVESPSQYAFFTTVLALEGLFWTAVYATIAGLVTMFGWWFLGRSLWGLFTQGGELPPDKGRFAAVDRTRLPTGETPTAPPADEPNEAVRPPSSDLTPGDRP